jgi:isocitrate dehydrogenase
MDKIISGAGAGSKPQATNMGPEILTRSEGKTYPRSSVGSAMTRSLVVVPGSALLNEATQYMQSHNIHSIVVRPNGSGEWGIMTMRDVVEKLVREGRSVDGLSVADLASHPLITIGPEASLSECAALMVDKNIRRVVVAEGGQPVGIISEVDIFRLVAERH